MIENNENLNSDAPVSNIGQENYSSQLEAADQLIEAVETETQEHIDFSKLDKDELLKIAEDQIHATDVRKAQTILNAIKEAFDALIAAERPTLIKEWVDNGNEARDFKAPVDIKRQKLNTTLVKFKEKREEERKQAEQEKLANLNKKRAVLEKMKNLVSEDETENSREQVRELQRQWKEIRQIPREFKDELNETYKFYLDKYYDRLSQFNELKNMDREKNLDDKIELIKKAESLKDEPNIRKAIVTLNKYHEDWKAIGPVPKEHIEEIWHRFKQASDIVLEEKRKNQEEIDRVFKENYEIKKIMVEKAEQFNLAHPSSIKDWQESAKQLDLLFDQWKAIGAISKAQNDELWPRFTNARNTYFSARREFFNTLNESRVENLKLKEALCEKAEKLVNNQGDINETSDALAQLQEEWKKIGPVPENKNDIIWKKFRASFETFYTRKNEWYQNKRQEENVAIEAKKAIIAELAIIAEKEDSNEVFAALRDCQQRWVKAGFVNPKLNGALHRQYQDLNDKIFTKFKSSRENMKENIMKDHYNTLSGAPDGNQKLFTEERKIKDRISKINDEIGTLERNLSFFGNSKNAESIRKEYEGNINKLKEQIDRLNKELKVIKDLKNKERESKS